MSKAAQFEAEEAQAFIAPQPPQQLSWPAPGPMQIVPVQQMYVAPQYPMQIQIHHETREEPRSRPDCCTACWGVFLLVWAIASFSTWVQITSAINDARLGLQLYNTTMRSNVT